MTPPFSRQPGMARPGNSRGSGRGNGRHAERQVTRDERGVVTVWFASASFVMIILVGLAVDLSGQVHDQQRIRDVAAQAARTGGEQVQASSAIQGNGVFADTLAAKRAALGYLAAARVDGSVRVVDGTFLVVRTTTTYRTKFLSLIGLTRLPVTGSATARLVRVAGGAER